MSLKANELRVGNYVKGIGYKITWLIEGIESEYIYSSKSWRFMSSFEGIPLTEEWILKFGFECIFTHDDHYYYLESLDLGLDRSYQPFGIGKYKVEFKYVHQLQNLYFALTGKELTIVC